MRLSKEEKNILNAYERGQIKTVSPSKNELKEIKMAAEKYFSQKQEDYYSASQP